MGREDRCHQSHLSHSPRVPARCCHCCPPGRATAVVPSLLFSELRPGTQPWATERAAPLSPVSFSFTGTSSLLAVSVYKATEAKIHLEAFSRQQDEFRPVQTRRRRAPSTLFQSPGRGSREVMEGRLQAPLDLGSAVWTGLRSDWELFLWPGARLCRNPTWIKRP